MVDVKKMPPALLRLHSTYRRGFNLLQSVRYRTINVKQRLIVVVGDGGEETISAYLAAILRETGDSVETIINSDKSYRRSTSQFHAKLAEVKRTSPRFLIVRPNATLIETLRRSNLFIDTILVSSWNNLAREAIDMLECERLVVPYDGLTGYEDRVGQHNFITYGSDKQADMAIESVKLYPKGTEATLRVDHHDAVEIATYLIGALNVYYAVAAISAAYLLGINRDVFPEAIARVEAVEGNFEQESVDGHTVVQDDVASKWMLPEVVNAAKAIAKRRVLVAYAKRCDEATCRQIKEVADRVVVLGSNHGITGVEEARSPEEAADVVLRSAKKEDIVVLAGKIYRRPKQNKEENNESTSTR